MGARFQVEQTFQLQSRRLFVARGNILDGAVQRGQRVVAPSGIDVPVDSVEFVSLSATKNREAVALCFRYRDDDQLAQWRSLSLAGQILELADSTAGEARAPAV